MTPVPHPTDRRPPDAAPAPPVRSRPGRLRWGHAVLVFVLLAAACGGDPSGSSGGDPSGSSGEETRRADDRAWPGRTWEPVDPATAGLDPAALEQMATTAEAGGSECLVVTHEGRMVAEWYWRGSDADRDREAFSVTKSITAALVGIAQDRGLLDIGQPVSDFVDEWKDTPSEAVTIRHVLSNDSGRHQDDVTDYLEMAMRAPDKTAFSVGLAQQHEPGTTWAYNNAAIQTLEAVLEEATGRVVADFAEEALFEPLGMDTTISRDTAGNTLMFMGAQASCPDLARFGLLHLRGGEWNGERVISEEWVEESTSPSQLHNPAYGYLWWLNTENEVGGEGPTRFAPSAPADVFMALGLNGQVVAVYPSEGLVVTRMGEATGPDSATFGIQELTAGLQRALGGEAAPPDGSGSPADVATEG